jgi:hypothetical protein
MPGAGHIVLDAVHEGVRVSEAWVTKGAHRATGETQVSESSCCDYQPSVCAWSSLGRDTLVRNASYMGLIVKGKNDQGHIVMASLSVEHFVL